MASQICEEINRVKNRVRKNLKQKMEKFKMELKFLEQREDFLFEGFSEKKFDSQTYEKQLGKLRSHRDQLTLQLEQANDAEARIGFETVQSTIELAKNAEQLWNLRSPDEKKLFLEKLLSNPTLSGVTIDYDLKKPFEKLKEMKQIREWRPQRESNPCLCREREQNLSSTEYFR